MGSPTIAVGGSRTVLINPASGVLISEHPRSAER